MANRLLISGGLAVLLVGCAEATDPNQPRKNTDPKEAPNGEVASSRSVVFYGATWILEGPYRPIGALVPLMEGQIYRSEHGQSRLLLLRRPENANHDRDRIALVQRRNPDGHWVTDGPFEEWFTDGEHRLGHYSMGELHGEHKAWYPTGQLHVREHYSHGKLNGLSEGWYENGQKQFESQYMSDIEVAGKSWREDGTLRD